MDKAPFILVSVFAAILSAEFLFYRHIKRKQTSVYFLNKKITESVIAYVIIVSLFTGWLYFGEDRSVYVECRRETMECVYMHSTEFNKTLRPVKTYDVSGVQVARIRQRHRRKSSYHVVELLKTLDDRFELPMEFNSKNRAAREAERFNEFLQNKKNFYTYTKYPDSIPFRQYALFFSCFFGIILSLRLFWDFLEADSGKLRSAKKKKPLSAPETETVAETDVIQRKHRD